MEIIDVSFDGWQKISIAINWIAILILIVLIFLISFIIKKIAPYLGYKSITIDEATLGIGDSTVTLKFDRRDQEISYKLWVELSTRKIGIPYDENNDVIIEIYNSWYDFFGIARELLKEIPGNRLQYSEQLITLTQKVLNEGLRPHLTRWQAKYRRWYDVSYKDDDTRSPQEFQKKYQEYDALIQDLKMANERMIEYKGLMYTIAFKND